MAAKLLERALHDDGPWTVSIGPLTVPAERLFGADAVTFRAQVPEHCWMGSTPHTATLACAGTVLSAKPIDHPGDAAFTIMWRVSADEQRAARSVLDRLFGV
jgi:hypothetical protein